MSSVRFRARVIVIQEDIANLEISLASENKTLNADRRTRERKAILGESPKAYDELIDLQEKIIEGLECRLATEKRKLQDVRDEFADECAEEEEA